MNSKNIKVVDEHNIDRNANVMFAFDLEGSEYVSYWIERDEENSNIFASKIIKNIDGTFNMLDIDDASEKSKLNDIVKTLITNSVESQADKLSGDTVTLSDGKVVKLKGVSFNKEQRINVQKTYITTVKKEVVRVTEKYYTVEAVSEQPKTVEDIFPSVTPVVEPVKEVVPQPAPVVETPVLATPTVEVPKINAEDNFVAFGTESTIPESKVEPQVLPSAPVVEPVKEVVPEVTPQPTPAVVEPITVAPPVVEVPKPVEPAVVLPTPEPASVPNNDVSQPLIFNASKETNLNAALGEVASSTSIPVENIEPVREFGVDEPVVSAQPAVTVAPVQPADATDATATSGAVDSALAKKGGFANSKFFMVVSIAFFLASCVFLGYEVFNYFQLTK